MFRNPCIFPNFRRLRLPMILATITALLVTACNPANFKTEAAQRTPQLILSTLSDPKTFNYALSQESPNIFPYTFEGLTTQNSITGEIEPTLAQSWDISDDGLRFVFTLRENLKWSDGKPLTAEDVAFTYNDIYFNHEIPTDVKDAFKIGESGQLPKVKKLDQRRIEFILPEPFRPFLQNMTTPILPAHALRESVEKKDGEGKPLFLQKWGVDTPVDQIVTNGLYKLGRYNTTQRVIFERNPNYWRNPQPYIEKVNWEIVESQDTSLLQFRSGSLDSIGVTPDYFSLLKREEKRGNFKIYNGGPATGTSFVFFNLNKGKRNGKPLINPVKSKWFNNKEFRQAVAYAIDRQTMINNTFQGLGQTQNSPISVQSPYYLPPEKGLKVYDYNLDKARELLKKAGFKFNSQGQLLDDAGNRVRFTLLTNSGNKIREAMGAQIKGDLSKIGIQVDFTPLAWNTYLDKISNSLDFEMALLGLTGGLEPNDGANVWKPEGGLHMFNQKPQPGQKPIEGWEVSPWEAEIARLYVQATQELDEAKVKEIYAETQRITQENLPFIYLVNPLSLSAIRNKFEGIQYNAIGGAFWNLHEIKITEE
ncbi:ABC transporter substrate-binding protein [Plectonema cf. radiosum LEGE 06105]|uniref:ABC transporter substrate-binding protein n=1 Tax=Plectonema cf. radiosum LEGE 06105 TaxID=945769 RepID=A0A8J7JSR9_9CYAN|nr:ABC transporter substrate-binding protein [Plectonema radiosum]MBE9211240.1 ABC transporter substrate-binding protein [Plectonema cf. radiosum LEGE 06105]